LDHAIKHEDCKALKAVEDSEEILEHEPSFTYGKETKHPRDANQNENSKRSLDFKQPFRATIWVSGVWWTGRQFVHDQRERDGIDENNKQNRGHESRKERYVSKTTIVFSTITIFIHSKSDDYNDKWQTPPHCGTLPHDVIPIISEDFDKRLVHEVSLDQHPQKGNK